MIQTRKQREDPEPAEEALQHAQVFKEAFYKSGKGGGQNHRREAKNVKACSPNVSEAGAPNELRLAKTAREQPERAVGKYLLSRKNREGPGPVLGADGVMLANDRYKAELPTSYLSSIFSSSRKDFQIGKYSIKMVKKKL